MAADTHHPGFLDGKPLPYPSLTKAHDSQPHPSHSLDDEGGAIELMHKEGQDSGLLLGWLGLKRLGAQAVTEGWLHSIRHEEAAQDLRYIVSC